MDNIGEYIWALFAIILTFASLFKGIGKRKPQRKTKRRSAEISDDTDMPFNRTFEELRKSIAEAAKRSYQPQQTIVRQPKSDIRQPKYRSTEQPISTVENDNARFAATRQFYASATIKPAQAMKTTAKKPTESPKSTKSAAAELVKNKELSRQFNLRDAIVYSEIMKPKFED